MLIKTSETIKSNNDGIGRLRFNIFTENEALPVDEARIKVFTKDKQIEELVTDSSGTTLSVDLKCPDKEFSLISDSTIKPYAEYDVEVSINGFEPVHIEGVEILADTTAIQRVNLNKSQEIFAPERTIQIPEHTLWGVFPEKIPEDEIKELPPPTGFVVLDNPVIPEFIVVHAGHPDDASAKNYYVKYRDYIKNVASSEIYATWPANTIRANVLAIMSFTLNRVFTEWYRGKGKNFTITSSTQFDQAFTYGRNIYNEISVIVDEIFQNYITRPGIRQPLFAQYCDGQRASCPNWLSQWGSKTLGDQGHDAVSILRRYYGGNVYLDQAKQVSGVPTSFTGDLSEGSRSEAVRTIQTQLNAISNNYPAIPKNRVDGIFGPSTRDSVETFQKIFNIPQTGIVNSATWYRISDIYVAVTKLAQLV